MRMGGAIWFSLGGDNRRMGIRETLHPRSGNSTIPSLVGEAAIATRSEIAHKTAPRFYRHDRRARMHRAVRVADLVGCVDRMDGQTVEAKRLEVPVECDGIRLCRMVKRTVGF